MQHIILTLETCGCGGITGNCPVCDWGRAVCANCGRSDAALQAPCEPRLTVGAALREWLRLKGWLTMAVPREKELRRYLLGSIFGMLTKGTQYGDYAEAYAALRLKAVQPVTHDLILENLDSALAALPHDVAAGLVERKPVLVASAYAELSPEHKAIFARAVNEKPGLPSLEVHSGELPPN
jgi:hypothetical protein